MSKGLPIRDWDKLIEITSSIKDSLFSASESLREMHEVKSSMKDSLFSASESLRKMYILMSSESNNTAGASEMPIPLNVKLMVGTGNILGKYTPLPIFKEIRSSWENILRETIDSDQGITGYKIAKFKSFQPGETYTFNVNVNSEFTDFRADVARPIQVFLIDINHALAAAQSLIMSKFNRQFWDVQEDIPLFIGYLKSNGFVTKLLPSGGSFEVTPGNFQCLIHFSALTSESTEGCVITDYDKATQTFTVGGY